MNPDVEVFWLVWNENPHGVSVPTYKHASESAARAEAVRLAGVHRGSRFWVMRAVAGVRTAGTEWINAVEYPF